MTEQPTWTKLHLELDHYTIGKASVHWLYCQGFNPSMRSLMDKLSPLDIFLHVPKFDTLRGESLVPSYPILQNISIIGGIRQGDTTSLILQCHLQQAPLPYQVTPSSKPTHSVIVIVCRVKIHKMTQSISRYLYNALQIQPQILVQITSNSYAA